MMDEPSSCILVFVLKKWGRSDVISLRKKRRRRNLVNGQSWESLEKKKKKKKCSKWTKLGKSL